MNDFKYMINSFMNEATLTKSDNIGKNLLLNALKFKVASSDSERVAQGKNDRLAFFNSLGFNLVDPTIFLGLDKIASDVEGIFPGSKETSGGLYFQVQDKIVNIIASKKALNTYFIHDKAVSCSAKFATEIKETASMLMFEAGKELSEIELKDKMYSRDPEYVKYWKPVFYTSAIAHLEAYKSIGISKSGCSFERQGINYSKILYESAKKMSGLKSPDNWNPADVWVFTSKGISELSKVSDFKSLVELNSFVREQLSNLDIIGISLKQVVGNKASIKLNNMGEKLISNMNFSITKDVDIPLSFKSIMTYTKDAYFLKGNMRGSGDTLNLNFEGRLKGKEYNEGAFPSELWDNYKLENNGSNIISGVKTPVVDKKLFEETKEIYKHYKGWIKKGKEIMKIKYSDLDEITRQRYWIIAHHLDYIIQQDDKLMKYSFFSSQKLHDKASAFYKIAE